MTTPVWVPILVGGLGMVGTLGGTLGAVVITQRRSDDRDRIGWERERERERERWDRENAARTFEARREAYVDFLGELRKASLRVYDLGLGLASTDEQELPEGWQLPAYEAALRLQVYAPQETRRLAMEAYSAVWRWGQTTRLGRDDDEFYESHAVSDETEDAVISAIRRDLMVPEGPF